jgi:hypothetical protein
VAVIRFWLLGSSGVLESMKSDPHVMTTQYGTVRDGL